MPCAYHVLPHKVISLLLIDQTNTFINDVDITHQVTTIGIPSAVQWEAHMVQYQEQES
jgi:hypothetical protein